MKKMLLSVMLICSMLFVKGADYTIGESVEDFSLTGVDGKKLSLADLKNAKGAVVIFTCNHCPFSVAYEDRIIALDKKYKDQGFPVVAINPNDKDRQPKDSFEHMIERAKEKKFTFPYLYDETQEIAANFGATRTPHVYVLEKVKDSFVVKYIGAIDNNSDNPNEVSSKFVEDAIEALLKGKEVPLAETKAIGCTIKWREKGM